MAQAILIAADEGWIEFLVRHQSGAEGAPR
jgi:hypothetical protein